jgi:histidine triad (HIT) family protein
MTNPECIFCKIIAGDIPGDIVHKDDIVTAFRDINPVAPTHILIVPNKHIPDNNTFSEQDETIAGRIFWVVKLLAKQEGISETGYRLIMNTGPDSHQEVMHMHMHLIGGQGMKYPMG